MGERRHSGGENPNEDFGERDYRYRDEAPTVPAIIQPRHRVWLHESSPGRDHNKPGEPSGYIAEAPARPRLT